MCTCLAIASISHVMYVVRVCHSDLHELAIPHTYSIMLNYLRYSLYRHVPVLRDLLENVTDRDVRLRELNCRFDFREFRLLPRKLTIKLRHYHSCGFLIGIHGKLNILKRQIVHHLLTHGTVVVVVVVVFLNGFSVYW